MQVASSIFRSNRGLRTCRSVWLAVELFPVLEAGKHLGDSLPFIHWKGRRVINALKRYAAKLVLSQAVQDFRLSFSVTPSQVFVSELLHS